MIFETNLIPEIFLLFAKYPLKAGVLDLFQRGNSSGQYAELKEKVNSLENHSLIPSITKFVFGVTESKVTKIINDISGKYILVDYGALSASVEGFNVKKGSIYVAVTVAAPIAEADTDLIDEIVFSEECLSDIRKIREDLVLLSRKNRTEFIGSNQITPFHAPPLNNSIGWTLTLTISSSLI